MSTTLTYGDWERVFSRESLPNFHMSNEYFQAAGYHVACDGNLLTVRDEVGGQLMFPPIREHAVITDLQESVQMDFPGYTNFNPDFIPELFDVNYIFVPEVMTDKEGKIHKVFRHNVNAFDKAHPDCEYKPATSLDAITVLEKWCYANTMGIGLHDGDTALEYFKLISNNCCGLWYKGELLGVNVWDRNWKYINFRYSFTVSPAEHPFVNEYLRHCFYELLVGHNVLVNDGGDLGMEGLRRFKLKMRPCAVYPIFSWNRKGNGDGQTE